MQICITYAHIGMASTSRYMRVLYSLIVGVSLIMMVFMYVSLSNNSTVYQKSHHQAHMDDAADTIEIGHFAESDRLKFIDDRVILPNQVHEPDLSKAGSKSLNIIGELNINGNHQLESTSMKTLIENNHDHKANQTHFHHWHVEQSHLTAAVNEHTIAVGLAITTRGQPDLTPDRAPSQLPFFRRLLQSFCHTATRGYDYHFYVAHDHTDSYFQFLRSHTMFEVYFEEFVKRNCYSGFNVTLHLVECAHSGNPAWAQNDAMMEAYMDNIAYYYRVNDDTVMETPGWTERLIEQLMRNSPPNVGVSGPWFRDGNTAILTHDFVHRTHIDIFGFYYPRVFTDWFADDWITGVYYPERTHKVNGVHIKHTMELGSRYVAHYEKADQVALEVEIGRSMIRRWLLTSEGSAKLQGNSSSVIAMSLHGGNHDATFGTLRYAQLLPLIMPDWRLRVYMENPANETVYLPVPSYMLRKLSAMGVEVEFISYNISKRLPPDMWPLLIVDDVKVEYFLIRDARMRPSEREYSAVSKWMASKRALHCIRDHPRHSTNALVPTLIGGVTRLLRKIIDTSWLILMNDFKSDNKFLNQIIWPLVNNVSMCHDSVSCLDWPGALPYPELRNDNEFVGRYHDENDVAEVGDARSWHQKYFSPECVELKDTGFQESAVRAVVQYRPVVWSQDYHITPIMDIKSLLSPIGVKVIDKSLSYHCGKSNTCAKGLRVINRENGMRLSPIQIEQFYQSYKNDPEMKQVTVFVCALPVSMCEAFLKFNRSMIVWATIRYEQGRPEPQKWQELNSNLLSIYHNPRGILAANNEYDAQYMKYFLGVEPTVIPNYCAYLLRSSYKPSRKQFLVSPIHSTELSDKFYRELDEALMCQSSSHVLLPLRQMYPQYLFSDLAAHPAMVYIPYQVSMVSLTEQYRMNIPLFFPSIDLLTHWQLEFQVVRQRTWDGYMMKRPHRSRILGKLPQVPDPNDDTDEGAIKYWLQYADFYQWPHIVYYSSMDDLVRKLATSNLTMISNNMAAYNVKTRLLIKNTWSDILLRITGPGR